MHVSYFRILLASQKNLQLMYRAYENYVELHVNQSFACCFLRSKITPLPLLIWLNYFIYFVKEITNIQTFYSYIRLPCSSDYRCLSTHLYCYSQLKYVWYQRRKYHNQNSLQHKTRGHSSISIFYQVQFYFSIRNSYRSHSQVQSVIRSYNKSYKLYMKLAHCKSCHSSFG